MTDTHDVLSLSVREFIERVAAKSPTPGGGSVAGVVAALAAALGQMALAYSRGKKSLAAHEAAHEHLAGRLARANALCQTLVSEDIEAFGLYQAAQEMDEGPARTTASRNALATAINVPRELAKLCLAMLDDLHDLSDKCAAWLAGDLAGGAALAVAAVRICEYNVRANTAGLDDASAAQDLRVAAGNDVRRADQILSAIEDALRRRG